MLADQVDSVIGVDTHRDRHWLALLTATTGGVEATFASSADPAGYRHALAEAGRVAPGRRLWAIEGAGAYGAGLRRFLLAQGERVCEAGQPGRRPGRQRAKSDPADAVRAARAVLAGERLRIPRQDGAREALRVLVLTRRGAQKARTNAIRQLKALVVTAPDALRERLRTLGLQALLRQCERLRPTAYKDALTTTTAQVMRALAQRALWAAAEIAAHERAMLEQVRALSPELLHEPGVGKVTAAELLVSFSHPGRLHSEAAFCRLGGVAPLEASSGQTERHRLDRGGDRQLNHALHTVVLTRQRCDEQTKRYIKRRMGEGKSKREAVRCLKRYVARHLFRLMEATVVGG